MRKALWTRSHPGLVTAVQLRHSRPRRRATSLAVGATAPNFTLPSQEDKPISLTRLTRASGSSSTSTPRTDHRLHHRGAQLPARPGQVRRRSTRSSSASASIPSKATRPGAPRTPSASSCSPIPTTRSSTPTACPSSTHGDMKFASRETFLISPAGQGRQGLGRRSIPTPTAKKSSPRSPPAKEVTAIISRRKKARALN